MESLQEFSIEEIKQNDGQDGRKLWVLIDGKVYDVSSYKHPGGREILEDEHGEDRIDEFNSIGHSPQAKEEMKKFHIGFLKAKTNTVSTAPTSKDDDGKKSDSSMFLVVPIIAVVLVLILAYNLLLK